MMKSKLGVLEAIRKGKITPNTNDTADESLKSIFLQSLILVKRKFREMLMMAAMM